MSLYERLHRGTLIVAEIGNNHEGDMAVALRMIDAAADCGVDAVKFQTFKTEEFISPTTPERFARLKGFELPDAAFATLAEAARARGLLFISTPLDLSSADLLAGLVDYFKVASSDLTFYPLLRRLAVHRKPIILSTGISDIALIQRAVAIVTESWQQVGHPGELALLHCVTSYPTPLEQVNLRALYSLKAHFDYPVGYSDHTLGIQAALLSVGVGARIVEKHFTLDKQYSDFRDHQLSADPPEMRQLVQAIRQADILLGEAHKAIQAAERPLITAVRRSIAAKTSLPAGHILSQADLVWLRPGEGLPPGNEDQLVGRRLKQSVAAGQTLRFEDVE